MSTSKALSKTIQAEVDEAAAKLKLASQRIRTKSGLIVTRNKDMTLSIQFPMKMA